MRASQRIHSLLDYLADGPRTSEEVRKYLAGISPATLCRLVSSMEGRVLQLGKARATIYARPREFHGSGFRFPVFRVDMDDNAREIGTLFSIKGGYAWNPSLGVQRSPFFALVHPGHASRRLYWQGFCQSDAPD